MFCKINQLNCIRYSHFIIVLENRLLQYCSHFSHADKSIVVGMCNEEHATTGFFKLQRNKRQLTFLYSSVLMYYFSFRCLPRSYSWIRHCKVRIPSPARIRRRDFLPPVRKQISSVCNGKSFHPSCGLPCYRAMVLCASANQIQGSV